eukprot:199986_1
MTNDRAGKYSSVVEQPLSPSPPEGSNFQVYQYGLSTVRNNNKLKAGLCLVGITLFCLLAVTVNRQARSAIVNESPIFEGVSKVRDCTFDECYASSCDENSAPFICEFHNGGPHGGCSPIPWIEDTCDDQCYLKNCESLDIPDSTETCKGLECDENWCEIGQLCGGDNKFQCTQGSSRFGCSSDELEWTLRTAEVVCSSCCDVTTC